MYSECFVFKQGFWGQFIAVETRLTHLEGVITAHLARTMDGSCENLTATLGEVTDGFNRRVDALQVNIGFI